MQGATVLVVDDDESIRTVVAGVLEDEGYQTLTATNGKEAIAFLESTSRMPDIMLLDLLMPEMSGYEVLDHLRQNLLQEFPVLIFSAQRPDASILKALDSERRDFVAKPFDLEELLVRMQRLLQQSPRLASSQSDVLRVYTLGALRVYRAERLLFDESWRNKPAKTIFKLLFTHPGRRYPRDVLLEELWPEIEPEVAANRLRVAIHELRKVLDDRGQKEAARRYIGQQEGAYFFDTSVPYWWDAKEFEDAFHAGQKCLSDGKLDEAMQSFRRAEALYHGEYLRDDVFSPASIGMRERLREMHLALLSDVARIYVAFGEPGEAAAFCRKILRIEPWREEIYRSLMEYLDLAGRPHEALRVYEECRRMLRAEIEAEPSAMTVQLRETIAANVRHDGVANRGA